MNRGLKGCPRANPPLVVEGTKTTSYAPVVQSDGRVFWQLLSSAFSALTSGTNTSATMHVGTGASLDATGSGTITATSVPHGGVTGGTNHRVATYDASGLTVGVAPGTSGNVLTSDGTDWTSASPPSGALPVVSTSGTPQTILNSSSSTVTGAGNVILFANTASATGLTSGTDNTVVGNNAWTTGGATNTRNTVIGSQAATSMTGNSNVVIGTGAIVVTGATVSDSIAIGDSAIAPPRCTIIGRGAGCITSTTTATRDTAIGYTSAAALTDGVDNTFLGDSSGKAVTTAGNNTHVGSSAGVATTGANNTFIGKSAGATNTTGTDNVIIGNGCDTNAATTSTNSVIIGGVSGTKGKDKALIVNASSTALNSSTSNDLNLCSGDTGLHRFAAGVLEPTTGNGGTAGGQIVVRSPVISQTAAADYTLAATDDGSIQDLNTGASHNLLIPTDATHDFPIGTQITAVNHGAGLWTIKAVTSGTTTVVSTGATAAQPSLRAQYSCASIVKLAANLWIVAGDVA